MRRAQAVLVVHDVYPEALVATGIICKDGMIDRAIGTMAAATYRLYERVVVLGRDMQDVVGRRIGKSDTRTVVIPNWGDVDEIVPLAYEDNVFARQHNPDGVCVIQFSGNLGRTHNIESVLAAAHELVSEPDLIFQFVGEGGKTSLIRHHAASLPDNVQVLPRQPRDQLNAMLAGADAAIIAFVPGMRGVSVPSRMYNVMAAGTPIIAMAAVDSELALVVHEEACGWVLSSEDTSGLIDLARYLATSEGRADARKRGANGRQAAVRRFSRSGAQEEYRRLFREV